MKKNNHLIKNDFFKLDLLQNVKLVGGFDMPQINPTNETVNRQNVVPFNIALYLENKSNFYVHFYIDDYQFERVWNFPKKYMAVLKQFKGVIAPDFSVFVDMPKSMQIWNAFRSKLLTSYWQENSINVIPNVTWADETSFNFCFEGLPKNSTLAVSSLGCLKNPKALLNFCKGFKEMDKRLRPEKILFYGDIPESLKNDRRIVQIANHIQLRLQNLNEEDK